MNIIWTNDLDYDDWKEDLEEWYPDEEGYTEDDRMRIMYETNDDYLEDERMSLNKELGSEIVMIANLGLWYGRRKAYKFVNGNNLNNIFHGTCGDHTTWFVEDGEIKCDDMHHDGTNHYTYRLLKNDVNRYEFENYAYDYSVPKAVEELTEPMGHYVNEIYGWEEKDGTVLSCGSN